MSCCCGRAVLGKILLVVAFSLLVAACGSGAGVSADSPPLIGVEVDGYADGSAKAIARVTDASTGYPTGSATVTVNGVSLSYDATQTRYSGSVTLPPGATVNVAVSYNNKSYTASGTQFATFPVIAAPVSGAQWQSSAANSVSWSAGSPSAGAIYGVGVDSADTGFLTWPSNGTLQTVATGVSSYTIPAGQIPAGNSAVIVGMGLTTSIPGAYSGSTLLIAGFSTVPVTVIN